ncbi:hypothetical protein Hypma_007258 [Hypsizygus marmoreus]|uniref:Uncharacterized protein n=1 Tax=Hypsizygus marmoreus TaxID=39966 RepID=A0A369KFF0_HYPMA|nr:hypothetical protein Hypma_007258 [Hypsizygus marmoreus]
MNTIFDTVKAYNAFARPSLAPSGMVPNHWHFDLRYIALEPPSHILFLVQLESSFIHSERLPLTPTASNIESGITYFPESGVTAAPEICKALIHSFLSSFGSAKFTRGAPPPLYAPFKLTTEDPTIAAAVTAEFQRLGVRADLCKVHVVRGKPLVDAQAAFKRFWEGLKTQIGFTGLAGACFPAPDSIMFRGFQAAQWGEGPERDETERLLCYVRQLAGIRRLDQVPEDSQRDLLEQLEAVTALTNGKAIEIVRAEADAGNSESAIDYALRVQAGIKCTPNREVFHSYVTKVITSARSTPQQKSKAHALLLEWYSLASADKSIRYRYLHAAAYHANQATILASGAALPAVLFFGSRILKPLAEKDPALHIYKAVWEVLEKREREMDLQAARGQRKRAKKTNRCCPNAAVDAIQIRSPAIAVESAVRISHFSTNPSLIDHSLHNQSEQADWKIHKPFCSPGAPCSILEKDEAVPVASGSKQGSLSVPIIGPNGETILLSSATMSVEQLKEIREYSEQMSHSR